MPDEGLTSKSPRSKRRDRESNAELPAFRARRAAFTPPHTKFTASEKESPTHASQVPNARKVLQRLPIVGTVIRTQIFRFKGRTRCRYATPIRRSLRKRLVGWEGFEPPKAMPPRLQRGPFGRSGTNPRGWEDTALPPDVLGCLYVTLAVRVVPLSPASPPSLATDMRGPRGLLYGRLRPSRAGRNRTFNHWFWRPALYLVELRP